MQPIDKTVKVLIVDDDPIVRKVLEQCLKSEQDIQIIPSALDAYDAREKIMQYQPDVLTLDIEMPGIDGLTFLKILMSYHPLPTIVISSFTEAGSALAVKAIDAGAIDVFSKSAGGLGLAALKPLLVEKIKAAAYANLSPNITTLTQNDFQELANHNFDPTKVILLGASSGGFEALNEIIPNLPSNFPPICIVQHIPKAFSSAFAKNLDEKSSLNVKQAQDGDSLSPGQVLIAPGDCHMTLHKSTHYYVKLNRTEPNWHQRPSIDSLFQSAKATYPKNIIAGVLSGMGRDGAEQLLELKKAGATTFAQDKSTSIVFGIPKVAAQLNAANHILPISNIPKFLCQQASSSNNLCTH